jgi:hypothetical protein
MEVEIWALRPRPRPDRTTYVGGDEERTRGHGIAATGFWAHAVSVPILRF